LEIPRIPAILVLLSGAKLAPLHSGGVCQNCPAKTDDALQQIFISETIFFKKMLASGHKPVKLLRFKTIFPYKFLLKHG
jgi:hypothetical protein